MVDIHPQYSMLLCLVLFLIVPHVSYNVLILPLETQLSAPRNLPALTVYD